MYLAYTPQIGKQQEETSKFGKQMDDEIRRI